MKNKIYKLKTRTADRGIFEAIVAGRKRVETRAATARYRKIKAGDKIYLACGRDKIVRQVVAARVFPSVAGLLKKYRPGQINPTVKTAAELREMYNSFPGYREKLKKLGLIAWELK